MNGQCGGCGIPATFKDEKSGKAYTVDYLKPIECIIDPDIGVEILFANDTRLHLVHHEIMAQGKMIEEAQKALKKREKNVARFTELNVATECR